MRVAAQLTLRNGDQEKLARMAASRAVEAGLARRARIVLLAAEGLPHTEAARRAGVSVPVVREWRSRYAAGGIRALADQPASAARLGLSRTPFGKSIPAKELFGGPAHAEAIARISFRVAESAFGVVSCAP